MNIALIGYGKMGQEIEKLVREGDSHKVVSISYKKISDPLEIESIKKADVAIDFTSPEVILNNIPKIAAHGVNLVVGTTGWYDQLAQVKETVEKNKIGLIYAGNFSIGANIFAQIVGNASKLFSRYVSLYDVYGHEVHHKAKQDSPSGTAKNLADVIMKNFPSKKKLQNQALNRAISGDELHFSSVRGGSNPGRHTVVFDSIADEIILSHQAHSRRGFAQGALVAAEFIKGKKGLYQFEQLFTEGNL